MRMRTPGGAAPGIPRDLRTQRGRRGARRRRPRAIDATTEPEPGPPPEAVFDRITGPYRGPYVHRPALALLGACEYDEET